MAVENFFFARSALNDYYPAMTDQRDYRIITGRDTENIRDLQVDTILAAWPEFMLHDIYIDRYWNEIFLRFPEYQFVLMDRKTEKVLAVGNSFPLPYDGDLKDLPEKGLDGALELCFNNIEDEKFALQCAFQVVVDRGLVGAGFSYDAVRVMIDIGRKAGHDKLVAPVRPNRKSLYPLTPMEKYVRWQNDEGLPFDGWMRVHARLGAEIIKVCPESMLIEGTVAEWEEWTGLTFPDSGQYIIPGTLVPITIDREADKGVYIEPNVWMAHPI